MRVRLSSPMTGFYRTFLPFVWGGSGVGPVSARHLRVVWLEEDRLVIRIPGGEHPVPLSYVEEVSEAHLTSPKTITVRLRFPSGETQDIMFAVGGFSFWFGEHPTAQLLRKRAEEARARGGGSSPQVA